MKKIIILLFLAFGIGTTSNAQFLKNLKTKAKTAMDNSINRSTDKVIDKTINNPADNITDSTLDISVRKLKSIFKKKKKNKQNNKPDESEQIIIPKTDSAATKPVEQNQKD